MSEPLPVSKKRSPLKIVALIVGLLVVLSIAVYLIFTFRSNLKGLLSKESATPEDLVSEMNRVSGSPFDMVQNSQETTETALEVKGPETIPEILRPLPPFIDLSQPGYYEVTIQEVNPENGEVTLKFHEDGSVMVFSLGEFKVMRFFLGDQAFSDSLIENSDVGRVAAFSYSGEMKTFALIIEEEPRNE